MRSIFQPLREFSYKNNTHSFLYFTVSISASLTNPQQLTFTHRLLQRTAAGVCLFNLSRPIINGDQYETIPADTHTAKRFGSRGKLVETASDSEICPPLVNDTEMSPGGEPRPPQRDS